MDKRASFLASLSCGNGHLEVKTSDLESPPEEVLIYLEISLQPSSLRTFLHLEVKLPTRAS